MSDDKPTAREWWIRPEASYSGEFIFTEDPTTYWPMTKGECVHVIEKSYADHFETLSRRQLTEIASLKTENERLRWKQVGAQVDPTPEAYSVLEKERDSLATEVERLTAKIKEFIEAAPRMVDSVPFANQLYRVRLEALLTEAKAALEFYAQFQRECDNDDFRKYLSDKGKTAKAALEKLNKVGDV